MTKLNFENPLAKVMMFVGGDYPVRLTHLEGLEFVPKIYHTVKYSDCDGQDTISQVHGVRTITGSGDIFAASESVLNAPLPVALSIAAPNAPLSFSVGISNSDPNKSAFI